MPSLVQYLEDLFTSKKEPATPGKVAAISSVLGLVTGTGLTVAAFTWPQPGCSSFGLYVSALGIFHLSEFFVTAKYNPRDLTISSFLLTNGSEYAGAQALAVIEAAITAVLAPCTKINAICRNIGLGLVLFGQFIRTNAMIKAGQSFSHLVAQKKKSDHVLVTDGIYACVRHPSYAAYFMWAVGTQIMLCNPVCTIVFSSVLYGFFKRRIHSEEVLLIDFFGDDYIQYRKKVWSGIPFV